ncbi:MAG: glutaredoxin family protein [Candidatus Sigynarchaeota archaeon]
MMGPVVLYATSTCPECERAARILDSLGIPYTKRLVDADPEAQADALMLNIVRVPAVVAGDKVLGCDIEAIEAAILGLA